MGLETSGAEIQTEALGGIGDTMVVGQIICFSDNLFITTETYVTDIGHITAYTILSIVVINIFAGFTSVQFALEELGATDPS
jgi:hypothetical protein